MMLCLETMVIQVYDNTVCAKGTSQLEAQPVVESQCDHDACAGCKGAVAARRRAEAIPFSCAEAACH